MTKIGIVIPIGSFRPSLVLTMRSLSAQKVPVALAVFNPSGDERVREIVYSFKNIVEYYSEAPDKGQADAIFKGWEILDTDIVGWLNDDDYLSPDTLDEVVMFFEDKKTVLVYGPSSIIDSDSKFRGMHPAVNRKSLANLSRDNLISQPSCLVRKGAVKAVGGIDNNLIYTMDWDLWVRLQEAYPSGLKFCSSLLSAVKFDNTTKTSKISWLRSTELYSIVRRNNGVLRSLFCVFNFVYWNLKHLNSADFSRSKTFFSPKGRQVLIWSFEKTMSKGIYLNFHTENFGTNVEVYVGASSEVKFIMTHGSHGLRTFLEFEEPRNCSSVYKVSFGDEFDLSTMMSIEFA